MNKYFLKYYGNNGVKLLAKYTFKEITPTEIIFHGVEYINYGNPLINNFRAKKYSHLNDEECICPLTEFEAPDDDSALLLMEVGI